MMQPGTIYRSCSLFAYRLKSMPPVKRSMMLAIALHFMAEHAFGQQAELKPAMHDKRPGQEEALIYKADFENGLNESEWVVEMESKPGSSVSVKDGKLWIDTKGGVTVWLNKRLSGNIQIEYKRTVLMNGKPNDRLSDLNQFWMAQDPRNKTLFTRNGVFSQYDALRLYYVGMGGNSNTTTRFRKYDGTGNKPLLQEYTDEHHLLKPGKQYNIKIIVKDGVTSFWVDGECYFTYTDPAPLREGYFGFRSVHSCQEIDDIKVYQLD